MARSIKFPDEIRCINASIAVAEVALAEIREAVRPGASEYELLAILAAVNIRHGGDWLEARLLASGDRINPWEREASSRLVRAGDLVAMDTDMIGPLGYCADMSRTFHCGPGSPTATQRELYRIGIEELEHNMAVIEPGVSFAETTERLWQRPERFRENRYDAAIHGVGMADEYPIIFQREDADRNYPGTIEPGMVLSVESYVGEPGQRDGVKLEEMVVVTSAGFEQLTRFPYEEALL